MVPDVAQSRFAWLERRLAGSNRWDRSPDFMRSWVRLNLPHLVYASQTTSKERNSDHLAIAHVADNGNSDAYHLSRGSVAII
jgi:hypothetical protein